MWAELPSPNGGRLVIVIEPGRKEDEENGQTGAGTSDRGHRWETSGLSVVPLPVTLPSHLKFVCEIYATSGSGNSVRLPSRLMAWRVQKSRRRDNCGHELLVVTGSCGKGFYLSQVGKLGQIHPDF